MFFGRKDSGGQVGARRSDAGSHLRLCIPHPSLEYSVFACPKARSDSLAFLWLCFVTSRPETYSFWSCERQMGVPHSATIFCRWLPARRNRGPMFRIPLRRAMPRRRRPSEQPLPRPAAVIAWTLLVSTGCSSYSNPTNHGTASIVISATSEALTHTSTVRLVAVVVASMGAANVLKSRPQYCVVQFDSRKGRLSGNTLGSRN
jgi:hypothetical protein